MQLRFLGWPESAEVASDDSTSADTFTLSVSCRFVIDELFVDFDNTFDNSANSNPAQSIDN